MRAFLIKISFYSILVVLLYLGAGFFANGHTDPYYAKISSPQQGSLIIGTSRSAQGIIPSVLNSELNEPLDFYNFSFTVSHSPYGAAYLKHIQNKVIDLKGRQIFILAVDPWALSSEKSDPNNEDLFVEKDLFLNHLSENHSHPNFEYLAKHYYYGWGKLMLNHLPNKSFDLFVHDDGWLEVDIPTDSASVFKRTNKKVKIYREEKLPTNSISDKRLDYLDKTIEFLSPLGDVYIVRLPVGNEIFLLEQELDSTFNQKISKLSEKYNCTFMNFEAMNENFSYTDGNHLDRDSAKRFTKMIAKQIRKETE